MDEFITRPEHDEFSRRIDEEQHRQNRRIDELEKTTKQISQLTLSVEKMACNMEVMTKEISRQGVCLEKIESEPGSIWKKIKYKAIDTAVGAIVGALICGIVVMAATYIK